MNNTALLSAIATFATVTVANAQSVTPMRGEIRSLADEFAVRVVVGNPYPQRVVFGVKVYDEQFLPVAATVIPPEARIGVKGARSVMVVVPFDGRPSRKVRVCAEGEFGNGDAGKIRTQVCGRYLATHLGP